MSIDAIRPPLTRERILRAAIAIADQIGAESLSMRKIGQQLGVEAMSLYYHVANKDDLLDGVLDLLVSEIEVPERADDWKTSLRQQALSARAVMRRHPWAPRLIASRPRIRMGPTMLRYMDSIAARLFQAGFSWELVHHAMHLIASRMLGYTQEPLDAGDRVTPAEAASGWQTLAREYPSLAGMLAQTHHDDEVEFVFGLDLLLEGLERLRDAS
jgi:AcrR family transcriptional regulator